MSSDAFNSIATKRPRFVTPSKSITSLDPRLPKPALVNTNDAHQAWWFIRSRASPVCLYKERLKVVRLFQS
jgi:hypothetical protein